MPEREEIQIYKQLAEEYLKGGKALFQICKQHEKDTGFFPDVKAAWDYVRKLRKEREQNSAS